MAAVSWGTEAEMLGSLMMQPSGVLALELSNGCSELGHRGGDVGQLDDATLGSLGQLTQPGEVVRLLLLLGQLLREESQDPAGERDVPEFDGDSCRFGKPLDDGEEGVGGQHWRLVGQSVNDLVAHLSCLLLSCRSESSNKSL